MRLPGPQNRLAVVGKTGSGKTQAALWQLSQTNFDQIPWFLLDWKREGMIGEIPGLHEHGLEAGIPDEAGLYRISPQPQQEEELTAFLWELWRVENAGLFVDEGYMVGARNSAFNALLTQGRSKNIPMITLIQRPAWVSRFVLSESEFFQIFHMNDERDRATIKSFLPQELDVNRRLPDFHSYYYDVAADEVTVLRPVPSKGEILDIFASKLPTEEQTILADPLRFV